jgi:chromosome segregation ATPase
MKETIIQINIIVREFIPRLSSLTGGSIKGERISIETTGGAGFEYVKQVLEKVEEEFRITKKENTHLKDRLQELLKQLDIYKNEVASNKEYERRKIEIKEDQLKKEVDTVKRDKDKMSERQAELALALKDVSEDLKFQKDENDRLKERISQYERS